ncbi:hypothetical protein MKEN_00753100 [Mycena kentingensis (nom. inval.)]|nr:hypothetical protein MKEN_00753100 [Mycena kentingensis (nom. inval.)]
MPSRVKRRRESSSSSDDPFAGPLSDLTSSDGETASPPNAEQAAEFLTALNADVVRGRCSLKKLIRPYVQEHNAHLQTLCVPASSPLPGEPQRNLLAEIRSLDGRFVRRSLRIAAARMQRSGEDGDDEFEGDGRNVSDPESDEEARPARTKHDSRWLDQEGRLKRVDAAWRVADAPPLPAVPERRQNRGRAAVPGPSVIPAPEAESDGDSAAQQQPAKKKRRGGGKGKASKARTPYKRGNPSERQKSKKLLRTLMRADWVQSREFDVALDASIAGSALQGRPMAELSRSTITERYHQEPDGAALHEIRFLEFTRMNQSGTGYQLRQHLGKAMQVRSKTIRAALAVYNELAVLLDRPPLEWDEIVNITFLSDFDLLRDSTSNIHNRRWARPAFRDLMHRYFRIVRAREEIVRLNVEIPRVLTWMRDDSDFLRQMEQSLRRVEGKSPAQIEGDLLLAVQLQDYAQQKHRFDDVHRRRFHDLSKLPGFTGSLELGVAVRHPSADLENDVEEEIGEAPSGPSAAEEYEESVPSASDDDGDDAYEERVADLVYQVGQVGIDESDEE